MSNVIDLATARTMRNRISVNTRVCALVADNTPHVIGENRAEFVARIVRAYLEGVR